MKLIDNTATLLIEEVKDALKTESKVKISCNHFTAFAVFELLESLSSVESIKVLIDVLPQVDDFRFIQSEKESILNNKLNRKFKVKKVIDLINNKFEIRKGGLGNQYMLFIVNEENTLCYSLTPLNF